MLSNNENEQRVRLQVMGLSVGQIRTGAYALVLAQVDGPVRIPVVIGVAEAQAIAARMEHVTLPRPMTHDLFTTMAQAYGIAVQEVFIYKFEEGVFYSELSLTDGERRVQLDSRTSDAIAIAMRTGAPIYTTQEILHHCGFVMEEQHSRDKEDTDSDESLSTDELQQKLDAAVADENYEEAARLTKIIKSRSDENNQNDIEQ
jgi:bifunctional DNase/RNase